MTTNQGFQRATRQASRLRIGLEAPAGAGKTWTALKIATVLAEHDGGRVALIDSERGSASKYADGRPFDFDTLVLRNAAPAEFIDALQAAANAKYPVAVVDSGSHEWKGVLQIVDRATPQMGGNQWSAWSKGRPAHDAFVDAILAMPAHVIVTFRSKQDTEQVKQDGKTVIRKLGLAPVTSDDMDYEFDVWGSIDHETHTVIITKSRIDTIAVGSEWPRGDGLAEAYLEWMNGAEYAEPPALESPERPQDAQQRESHPPQAPAPTESTGPTWGPILRAALADNGIRGQGPLADYLYQPEIVGPHSTVNEAIEAWLAKYPELDVRDLAEAVANRAKAGATA